MKFAALSGSLRKDSYNLALLNTMAARYKDKFEVSILDIGHLPHYNQDNESTPPEVVQVFKQAISATDGLIISTPEFNWSIPGVLKNALDWLSRGQKVTVDKPVLVVGASTGMLGTIRAQTHLRQILSSPGLNCRVLPPGGNEVLLTFAQNKFNEHGQLTDTPTLEFLDTVIDKFIAWI